MPRKPYARSLPELTKVLPEFVGFAPSDNHTARTTEVVRAIAQRVQGAQAMPFYSMREIASFLNVPYRTVSIAYERLQNEGVLTRIRGSHTMLEGRRRRPRHTVRGVIGVPVYLPALVIGADWRAFLIQLEEELRRHHFVTDFVIYRAGEQESDALTERLIEHDLDMVLWYAPVKANIPTMEHLLDGGIELVVVSDGKARFPREQYYLNLDRAVEDGLANWRQAGIRSVTLLRSPRHPSTHAFEMVIRLLKKYDSKHDVVTLGDDQFLSYSEHLAAHPDRGVVLTSHTWYEFLCGRYPHTMETLFLNSRVFLTQGPVYSAYFRGKAIQADSVILPNEQMAERLARDIHTQRTLPNKRLATFHTRYQPRMDLGTVSRQL